MKYEITMTTDRKVETHSVQVTVTDVDDWAKRYSQDNLAPERVYLTWTRYDDDKGWGLSRAVVTGRRRLKSGNLGAEIRDDFASRQTPWMAELVEELKPT